jgi:uncharacterized peroxidase-related enzyme
MALISSLKKDEVKTIAKEVYKRFERDTGKVPEWVRVMAHRPEILKEFTELFKAIMGPGEIELYLKWKIAYAVSQALKCQFCVDVTTKMLKKLGATEEMLAEIESSKDLSEEEREILDLARDITDNAHLDQPEIFKKLKSKLSEPQIIEVISVVGLFNYINRFNNTLAILPE